MAGVKAGRQRHGCTTPWRAYASSCGRCAAEAVRVWNARWRMVARARGGGGAVERNVLRVCEVQEM